MREPTDDQSPLLAERDEARQVIATHLGADPTLPLGQLVGYLVDRSAGLVGQQDDLMWLHAEAVWRATQAEAILEALEAQLARAVVLPEDAADQLVDAAHWALAPYGEGAREAFAAKLESWGAATQPAGDVDTNRYPAGDGGSVSIPATQPAEPPRPSVELMRDGIARSQLEYLLDQYDRLLAAVEHIAMDSPEDRERHAQMISTFRRAAAPVREAITTSRTTDPPYPYQDTPNTVTISAPTAQPEPRPKRWQIGDVCRAEFNGETRTFRINGIKGESAMLTATERRSGERMNVRTFRKLTALGRVSDSKEDHDGTSC